MMQNKKYIFTKKQERENWKFTIKSKTNGITPSQGQTVKLALKFKLLAPKILCVYLMGRFFPKNNRYKNVWIDT